MLRNRASCIFALLLLVLAATAQAQQKLLTIDDIYDAKNRVDFTGTAPTGLQWLADGVHYLQVKRDRARNGENAKGGEALKVNAATGESHPLFDAARMQAAFAKLGITAADARSISRSAHPHLNRAENALLVNFANDLFYYELGSERAVRLTHSPEKEAGEEFSPNGQLVSFVRANNLYVVDTAGRHERALISDGAETLLNGRLDWIYQEELYGRGNFGACWWSPDSRYIAFLRLDESPVHRFTIVDHIPRLPDVEEEFYPQPGDPNPKVRLGIAAAAGGEVRWVDDYAYQNTDPLIVRVHWQNDSAKVAYEVQDRAQTWLDLNLADPRDGSYKTLFRETSRAWVEGDTKPDEDPWWLKDGSFLWESERSGFNHVYHYSAGGKLLRQITEGKWEVRKVYGVDEQGGWLYFSSNEHSAIADHIYRIRLDGSGMQRLSQSEGNHAANFNAQRTRFVDTWSDVNTPSQVRVFDAGGSLVRVVDWNRLETCRQYKLGKIDFLQVKTRDGFLMEAMMIKPPDFDPEKKYPVMEFTYSGPHSESVRNAWGAAGEMWYQLLAEKGYIIWICDNRTSSGKGYESTVKAYKHLGELELRDLEDGVAWLKGQPYVDGARIGLHGWSYGGFMTSYALTHSAAWKMGIAGGTVTDWHLYDSIYTERYMNTPQNNPEGYAATSVVKAAKNLSGKLLLIHGTIDDNVHMQNTVQLMYELEKAGKQFDVQLYPKSRHGVVDRALNKHLHVLMTEYILKNL